MNGRFVKHTYLSTKETESILKKTASISVGGISYEQTTWCTLINKIDLYPT